MTNRLSPAPLSVPSVVEPLEGRRLFCGVVADELPHPAAHDSHPPAAALLEMSVPAATGDAASAPAAEGDVADVTPPTVTGVRVTGQPEAVTGLVLTFSEPLDPVRAQRVANYQIFRKTQSCDGGGFFGGEEECDTERRNVRLASATYDDATRTVTLTAERAIRIQSRLRRLRVVAGGPNGITDPAGNRLDGDRNGTGGDAGFFRFDTLAGRSITYRDGDRDRVRLRLTGPGRLLLLRQAPGQGNRDRNDDDEGGTGTGGGMSLASGEGVQLWLLGKVSDRTVLTGTVTQQGGDGKTTLREILNAGAGRIDLTTNPAFEIGSVIP